MTVVVLIADGARVDAFSGDMADLPALKRLRDEIGLHQLTTVFPSVTGPAYTPFLLGRFPGEIGIPGIRWFDRARDRCTWPDYSRSYVGHQLRAFDGDLDSSAPTMFELVENTVGALSVVTRGLSTENTYGTLTIQSAIRMTTTHFRGRPERWLDVDAEVRDTIPRIIRDQRPEYVFAAFTGADKASHARGHGSSLARDALKLVDATVAQIRADAERGGTWGDMHLWIVSDHGHSPVQAHDDLAGVIGDAGARTIAHPFPFAIAPEAAVMVSGNAMAHVYLDVEHRTRPFWHTLERRWIGLVEALLARESVDLVLLPLSEHSCEIRHAERGSATISRAGFAYNYICSSGDPLELGGDWSGDRVETWEATFASPYPDALVQIASLTSAARCGDVILSAAPGWDFRARYEPIPHVSTHGSLHRDHMLVPLLMNHAPSRKPRRTTDLFPSALDALGVSRSGLRCDGESFV